MGTIRDAVELDLKWIYPLWSQWSKEAPVPYADWQEVMDTQSTLFHAVVEKKIPGLALVDAPRAVLLWVGSPDKALHGYGVVVDPQWREKGVGGALLQQGLTEGRLRGFHRVFVSPYVTNKRGVSWLKRAGFDPVQTVMVKEF